MKRVFFNISLFILLMLNACAGKSQHEKTQIKVFNAMPADISMEFQNKKSGNNSENIDIPKTDYTRYHSMGPGIYEISVRSQNDELLKKQFGLAGGEKYTQIIYGRPSFSSRKNEETFSHKMHYIFEGSENYTKNGFLPGEIMFRDKMVLKKGSTSVRVFNAAAGVSPINLKLREGKKSKKMAKQLAYAKPVLSKRIKSGEKTIEVYLGNAPKPFIEQKFDFKSKKAYIIVVYNLDGKPAITVLEN